MVPAPWFFFRALDIPSNESWEQSPKRVMVTHPAGDHPLWRDPTEPCLFPNKPTSRNLFATRIHFFKSVTGDIFFSAYPAGSARDKAFSLARFAETQSSQRDKIARGKTEEFPLYAFKLFLTLLALGGGILGILIGF
jgi:hypothetical protein